MEVKAEGVVSHQVMMQEPVPTYQPQPEYSQPVADPGYECEYNCGFGHISISVVEAHEKACPYKNNPPPVQPYPTGGLPVVAAEGYECEYGCGFGDLEITVVEAHEMNCVHKDNPIPPPKQGLEVLPTQQKKQLNPLNPFKTLLP